MTAVHNPRLYVRLLKTDAAPPVKPTARRVTATYSPAAHWQNTWWAINACGVLWHFAGCKKFADGAE